MNLEGRCALITGANGGIGKQMALTIAELGGDLILVDHPEMEFSNILQELEKYNVEINLIHCDLEDEQSRRDLINQVNDNTLSPLNILINNAAFVGTSDIQGWVTEFEEQTVATWRRALEVNLTAAFDLSKGFAAKLKVNKGSVIINIGSIYGILGPDYSLYEGTSMGNPAAYAASKGGLTQLSRWLATTLAPDIRVNTISPGGVFRDQPEVFVDRYNNKAPLARMATEEDFKGAIAYLASDLSAYVTGENLIVDGGWSAW